MASMVGYGVLSLARVLRLRGRAQGTVVRQDSGEDGSPRVVVSFVTPGEGAVQFVSQATAPTGATVPVRYDERHPDLARVNTFGGSFVLLTICFFTFLMGVALIILG